MQCYCCLLAPASTLTNLTKIFQLVKRQTGNVRLFYLLSKTSSIDHVLKAQRTQPRTPAAEHQNTKSRVLAFIAQLTMSGGRRRPAALGVQRRPSRGRKPRRGAGVLRGLRRPQGPVRAGGQLLPLLLARRGWAGVRANDT